jgi:putative NADH-flavin reductase
VKLAVFGATGPTGKEVVAQALERGYEVTAFARRPDAVAARERLRVVPGDAVRDALAVAQAVRGQDAVVSALGVRGGFFPRDLMQRSLANIVPAMESAGVRRFVLMSALGVGASRKDAPVLARLMYHTLLACIFADKRIAEESLKRSALEWTIVYPVLLTNAPRSVRYRAAERLELRGLPSISRADVADFMLRELVERRFVRRTAVLSE